MSKEHMKSTEHGEGSDKELDQYGVWVSSDSEEENTPAKKVSNTMAKETDPNTEVQDLNDLLLSIDEEADQDETVYLEEENLDLDLDLGTGDFTMDDDSGDQDSITIPDMNDDEEEISIDLEDDDLTIPPLNEDKTEAPMATEAFETNIEEMNFDDIDLDDNSMEMDMDMEMKADEPEPLSTELSMEPQNELGLDEELDIDDDLDLELDEIDLDMNESSELDMESNVSLDDEMSIEMDDTPLDLPEPISMETELSLDDIESPHLPGAQEEESFVKESDIEISDEPLPDLELEDALLENQTENNELELSDFDDVDALTQDIMDKKPVLSRDTEEDTTVNTNNDANSSDAPVLSSIERELHAIRSELTDLRNELKRIRSAPAAAMGDNDTDMSLEDEVAAMQNEMETDLSEDQDSEKPSGFFDDDDDETIALTGDELDNILNSAEFTEEAGEPTMIEDDATMDMPMVGDPSESEMAFEEIENSPLPPIEEINLTEIDENDLDEESSLGLNDDLGEMDMGDTSLDIEQELAGIEDLSDSMPEEDDELDLTIEESGDSIELEIPEGFDEHPDIDEASLEFESSDSMEPIPTMTPTSSDSGALTEDVPYNIKQEIKAVLQYMDQLLDALPQEKIEAFARSEHFETYKKLFEELGI